MIGLSEIERLLAEDAADGDVTTEALGFGRTGAPGGRGTDRDVVALYGQARRCGRAHPAGVIGGVGAGLTRRGCAAPR